MTKAAKRKAPSRVKYEQSHPTVSCRISREIYDALRKAKEAEGKSFADILKTGLGITQAGAKKEEEAAELGFAEAELLFRVDYPCKVCGKMLTIMSDADKKAVRAYMLEHNWGHQECDEKSR
jgi:hypothetical protein